MVVRILVAVVVESFQRSRSDHVDRDSGADPIGRVYLWVALYLAINKIGKYQGNRKDRADARSFLYSLSMKSRTVC